MGILLLGGYFRFVGLNWDEFTHLHPDERFLTIVTSQLEPEESFMGYLRTSTSTLNPYNKGHGLYVYGNFPMTATFYIAQFADRFIQPFLCGEGLAEDGPPLCISNLASYGGVHLVGRLLSGLVDLLSVLFTFMIGRRLYGKWAALIATFFMATAVMAIQQSHFYTMDNWATLFTTMSLYFAVRASEDSLKIGWWVALGLVLGLNVASRINVAPVALVAGVAGLVWIGRQYQQSKRNYQINNFSQYIWSRTGTLDIQTIIIGGMLAALISMFVFRIAMPYAFSDAQLVKDQLFAQTGKEPGTVSLLLRSIFGLNPQWARNMQEIQQLQAPEASFPPALQWVGRTAILFPLTNMFLYGMGPLAALFSWLGVCFALWRTVSGKRDWMVHAIPLFWTLFYFLFIGTRWVKSIRYFLPIYPTLFILGGWFIVWSIQRLRVYLQHRPQKKTQTKILLTGFSVVATLAIITNLLWANGFTNIYRQPMTRVAATDWIYENVPTAISIIYSTDGQEIKTHNLPLRDTELFPGAGGYILPFTLPEDGEVQKISLNYVTGFEALDRASIRLSINGTFDEGIGENRTVGEIKIAGIPSRQRVEVVLPKLWLNGGERHQLHIDSAAASTIRLETSVLASEHWDDPLPVRGRGRDPYSQYYRGLAVGPMPTTHPDDDKKRLELHGWIDEADYIILSSQRSLWSLPRLPLTYPMMIHYYDGLFNGALGFELVKAFHGEMSIGPIDVNDTTGQFSWGETPVKGWPPPGWTAAEEAFSVYDHPPVWIFRKTADYDSQAVALYLAEADLQNATFQNPLEATQSPNGLYLSPADQAKQQAGGSWTEIFNPDGVLSNNGLAAAVVWWLTVVILGLITFPICFVVFQGLNDHGYALSRILAILLLSWITWLAASWKILPNSRGSYWLVLLLITAVNGWLAYKHQSSLRAFIQQKRSHLLKLELIGLALYALMLGVRLLNPDVWHIIWGGEKPMDVSYFTAVLKSTSFPPYDPWHAGGYINYYYYGFVYSGAVAKLLRIVPGVAYNLVLPMLFSFTGLALFSLTHTLLERSPVGRLRLWKNLISAPALGGLFTAAIAMLLGNLAEIGVLITAGINTSRLAESWPPAIRFFEGLAQIMLGTTPQMRPDNWFWNATRLISFNEGEVQPITEFPFFTFLYGDLHAHMIALPLSVLALGWAISLVIKPNVKLTAYHWLVGAVAIGVLYPTNSWDYPTYVVVGLLALVYLNLKKDGFSLTMVGRLITQGAFLFLLSRFAFQPFWANFGTAYGSISLWEGSYTPVVDFLTIYGLFLLVAVTWLFADLRSWATDLPADTLEWSAIWFFPALFIAFILLFVMVIGYLWGYELLPVVLTLILFAGLLALRPSISAERRIINVLFASSMGLVLFVEVFVLDGDIGRMNTVFKFYMQVWIMLSIVAGASLVWLLVHIKENWSIVGRTMWQTSFAMLLIFASLYPILGTYGKRVVRTSKDVIPLTLDGTKFMEYVTYDDQNGPVILKNDHQAIQWIQQNIPGSPVIAEAHGTNPYRSIVSRVAMYTGNPTIIGWDWHQRQQRPTVPSSIVRSRIADVTTLYSSQDIDLTMRIIKRYGVAYVYHGELENNYYGEHSRDKFDQMVKEGVLEQVYAENNVVIFKVVKVETINVN